ncbi:hypothetical protein BDK51DRAFT_38714 [Blyttiomyces helicus]|uniref:Uncharacterized protein n=1 Tax=Blyttiomyces helicus TaxID=388810 RepID=A0A4P9WHB4_9FUNG|nr:hypothetical protein BDK51DRAFT_38714 [Blyttiomyces helicus]|eukprot:RKO90798.1 hypothetical protein BDK51DRAFT_38714 [Blyttiomyces helicus]
MFQKRLFSVSLSSCEAADSPHHKNQPHNPTLSSTRNDSNIFNAVVEDPDTKIDMNSENLDAESKEKIVNVDEESVHTNKLAGGKTSTPDDRRTALTTLIKQVRHIASSITMLAPTQADSLYMQCRTQVLRAGGLRRYNRWLPSRRGIHAPSENDETEIGVAAFPVSHTRITSIPLTQSLGGLPLFTQTPRLMDHTTVELLPGNVVTCFPVNIPDLGSTFPKLPKTLEEVLNLSPAHLAQMLLFYNKTMRLEAGVNAEECQQVIERWIKYIQGMLLMSDMLCFAGSKIRFLVVGWKASLSP